MLNHMKKCDKFFQINPKLEEIFATILKIKVHKPYESKLVLAMSSDFPLTSAHHFISTPV